MSWTALGFLLETHAKFPPVLPLLSFWVCQLQADLKGANVLMKSAAKSNYDNRGYTCKLADFGLSRVMENNSTHVSTSTFGTAA